MGELLAHDPQRCDCAPAVRNRDTGGRLSGNATCNRLIASYTVEGSKLTISLAGTTMMACRLRWSTRRASWSIFFVRSPATASITPARLF
jgi:hypothetical protein